MPVNIGDTCIVKVGASNGPYQGMTGILEKFDEHADGDFFGISFGGEEREGSLPFFYRTDFIVVKGYALACLQCGKQIELTPAQSDAYEKIAREAGKVSIECPVCDHLMRHVFSKNI